MTTTRHPLPGPADAHQGVKPAPHEPGGQSEIEAFILEMLERLDAADVKVEHLQRALGHSRDIGAAVGVLMARHQLRQADAFELLRRTSQDLNRKLYDLALVVVETGELPTRT